LNDEVLTSKWTLKAKKGHFSAILIEIKIKINLFLHFCPFTVPPSFERVIATGSF